MDAPRIYRDGDPYYFVLAEPTVLRVPRLPLDLITCAMEFLPQADLRRAASASRDLYLAAHSVGLEIHRRISLFSDGRDVAIFMDAVDHISRKKFRADLALTLGCVFEEEDRNRVTPRMASILQAVAKSLPLLTRLRVELPTHFAAEFYGVTAEPAPRLREFSFTLERTSHRHRSAPALRIPSTLFGGIAPRLVDVILHGAAVGHIGETIPAFARVRRVTLNCSRPRPKQLMLAASFPAIRALALKSGARDRQPKMLVDLSGLALDRLLIIDAGELEHVRGPASAIPLAVSTTDCFCRALEYHAPLWPDAMPELLNAHVRRGETLQSLVVAVSAAGTEAWRHTIYTSQFDARNDATPLTCLPSPQTQLVSLTLDEQLLPQLVRAPQSLAALRELFIDCTARAAYVLPGLPPRVPLDPVREASPAFAVPMLRTLTAFARTGNVCMTSSELTALGLALGQANVQPREERAELVLAHVQLENFGLPSLRQTFRAVRQLASSDGVVPDYCDYRNRADIARFP